MNSFRLLCSRLAALFRRRNLEAEMAEEMRQHLERRTQEKIADGMTPEEARYAAQRDFGGVAQLQEQCRDERSWAWLEQARQDVRFAARGLVKSPIFTVVAVLTLALGIGLNTAMFTAVQAVLMRELPYPEADQLVQVFRTSPKSQRWPHAPAGFLEQQAQNDVFTQMAAFIQKSYNLAERGQPAERISGVQASAEMFPLLGAAPMLGRVFTAAEDRPGSHAVTVLAHGFWQRRFAGDPNILGRTLRIDGESVTVIGVMPPEFRNGPLFGPAELWTPLAFSPEQRANRSGHYLKVVARLKPEVSLAHAQTAMNVLAARQAREQRETDAERGLNLVPLADSAGPSSSLALWATMALAGFVLLIACANLANLQFARTAQRTRELTIRVALGATRGRLLRQLLTESLILALLGGVVGLVLAHWGTALLERQINESGELVLGLNWRVLGFALGVSSLAGLAFGLLPAWLASRTNAHEAMKQGARGTVGDRARQRVQHVLIVAEVALALALLAGAGQMMSGLRAFALRDPGWRVEGLTVANLSLPAAKYGSAATQRAFAARLEEKMSALPGVARAAVAWSTPIRQFDTTVSFEIAGQPKPRPGHEPLRSVNAVTPGYFEALGMELRAGRLFTPGDREGQPPVVIVNEALARAFWPDASPIGQRIGNEEIVGVVSDARFPTNTNEPVTRFQTYRPFAQAPRGVHLWMVLRGPINVDTLRRLVSSIDADLPLAEPGPAQALVDRSIGRMRALGWLLTGFGGLGLLLATLGIYGVIAGFAEQRTNEIGVRLALGAQTRDVLWLVLGKGLRLTLLGVAIGLAGALAEARLLAALAPALSSNDPLAIAGMVVLLVGVAALACWLPARRATKVDPMLALRAE